MQEQIEKLEKTRAQVMAKPDSPTDDAAAPTNYSQIKDIAPRLELESQLKANQIEIKNHQNEIKELTAKLADYQNRLGRAPVREQQLADITRDYDQSRANYDSLLGKMNQSEMATNLEKRQQGEHFRVVDAPNLPTKPYSPNRLKLSLMGLFAGLALGAVFTMGAEFTDDRVHSERVLKKMIPVDVIAEIPSLATVDEQSTQRREIWVALISAAVAMFIIAVGLGSRICAASLYMYKGFFHSKTKPLRDHSRSFVPVCYAQAQRGVGVALLRRATSQGLRGDDRRSGHRQDVADPLPARTAHAEPSWLRLRLQQSLERDGVPAVCRRRLWADGVRQGKRRAVAEHQRLPGGASSAQAHDIAGGR